MKIPKIIHQCHTKGYSSLSEEELLAISKNRNLNLDWEYRFYDLSDMRSFIKKNYEERYINAFDKINPAYGAAQADFFRYLVIYKSGGVYLDTKSFVTKHLNEIILPEDEMILFTWQGNPRDIYNGCGFHENINLGVEFQQWNIFCVKQSKPMLAVINQVIENIEQYSYFNDGVGFDAVINITGPVPYTNALEPFISEGYFRIAGNNELNGLMFRDDIKFPKRINNKHYSKMNSPLMLTSSINHLICVCFFNFSRVIRKLKSFFS